MLGICKYSDLVLCVNVRFSSEEVSAQNQVKASVQRKIRQSIAEEVLLLPIFLTFTYDEVFLFH